MKKNIKTCAKLHETRMKLNIMKSEREKEQRVLRIIEKRLTTNVKERKRIKSRPEKTVIISLTR